MKKTIEKDTKLYCNLFDGSTKNYLMRNNSFSVGFNMPDALSGDRTFRLPPYAKRMPYLVDKYPACPKDWLRSKGIVKSFFVPVIEGKGMWLDFNENENHTHHVAIVVSVQGVNPITGMSCNDAQLEQYIEECPKHKIKFGPDRYCKKCDYKWPKQNYITTTATPSGMFWLDGFRTVEGVVRQYILTAEKMRGVASNIIGKDRVYAIGLSFFVSKEKRPKEVDTGILRSAYTSTYNPHVMVYWDYQPEGLDFYYRGTSIIYNTSDNINADSLSIDVSNSSSGGTKSSSSTYGMASASKGVYGDTKGTYAEKKKSAPPGTLCSMAASPARSVQTKKLEVGAGAKINQSVYDDPERLDFWHDKPESIICVNYCSEKEAQEIIEQGEIDIEGHKEGYLKEVPVGN